MAAVLLRIVLPRRDFPRPTARRGTRRSTGNPNRLALSHLGRRARHVETRPRPLSSRRRITRKISHRWRERMWIGMDVFSKRKARQYAGQRVGCSDWLGPI